MSRLTTTAEALISESLERLGGADQFTWEIAITVLPQSETSFGIVSMVLFFLPDPGQIGKFLLTLAPVESPPMLLDKTAIDNMVVLAVGDLRDQRARSLSIGSAAPASNGLHPGR